MKYRYKRFEIGVTSKKEANRRWSTSARVKPPVRKIHSFTLEAESRSRAEENVLTWVKNEIDGRIRRQGR